MSKELRTGWRYYDGDTWHPDPSLTVIPGSLPPLPSQYTVTASVESSEFQYLGVFNKTERWWSGRPVYINDQGEFLYHDSRWTIGPELGYYSLQGSKSYQSPECEERWTYLPSNGSDDKPASVHVVPGDGEFDCDCQAPVQVPLVSRSCGADEIVLMKIAAKILHFKC